MKKSDKIRALFMELQLPSRQINDMCCLTFMALAGISEDVPWEQATNRWMRIHDMLTFMNSRLGSSYAENTRETIRKKAIHFLREAAFVEDNGLATNSPNYQYRITEEVLQIVRKLDGVTWKKRCAHFLKSHRSLVEKYAEKRKLHTIPVRINGSELAFSPGRHNALQKAILEEFAPRFAPGSRCLYVGDTTNRTLFHDDDALVHLGIELKVHNKLPDVVLYSEEKDWTYFIEAVTSCGPMSPTRKDELEQMTLDAASGIIYVTAFPDRRTFLKFFKNLAWDTEVWISDSPDHMIHFNGDRFLGPR